LPYPSRSFVQTLAAGKNDRGVMEVLAWLRPQRGALALGLLLRREIGYIEDKGDRRHAMELGDYALRVGIVGEVLEDRMTDDCICLERDLGCLGDREHRLGNGRPRVPDQALRRVDSRKAEACVTEAP
jgi:hypothetical protein